MRHEEEVDGEIVNDEAETGMATLEAQTRGEIDIQVSTAKRYPRSMKKFKDSALAMATLDEDTAEACLYSLPRGQKTIDGPSARLAEIIASAYGHMRIEGRVVGVDAQFVTVKGIAWDLENNCATAVEVKRRITDKNGKRFGDDMIGVTSNAAIAIGVRNATLKAIPKAFWQPIYLACRKIVAGDSQTLVARRDAMLAHFLKLGVQNGRVFESIGVAGAEDITLDHLVTLKGVASAIKNGEVTVEGAFDSIDSSGGNQAAPAVYPEYLMSANADALTEVNDLFKRLKMSVGQKMAKAKQHKDLTSLTAALKAEIAKSETPAGQVPANGIPKAESQRSTPAGTAAATGVETAAASAPVVVEAPVASVRHEPVPASEIPSESDLF